MVEIQVKHLSVKVLDLKFDLDWRLNCSLDEVEQIMIIGYELHNNYQKITCPIKRISRVENKIKKKEKSY
jgi:hypothetical protein